MTKTEMMGIPWALVGTGKNDGDLAVARITKVNVYSATFEIQEIVGRKLRAADKRPQEIFYSTHKTAAAAKGQTSWRMKAGEPFGVPTYEPKKVPWAP